MSFYNKVGLHWFKIWLALGLIFICIVWYLSLTPDLELPDFQLDYSDKYEHLLAYSWLMYWFGNLYHNWQERIYIALALVAMGIGIEYIQGMGTSRHFEYADMLADFTGVCLGLVLSITKLRFMLQKIENLLIKI